MDTASRELRSMLYGGRGGTRTTDVINLISVSGADPNVTDPASNITPLELLLRSSVGKPFRLFQPVFQLLINDHRTRYDIYNIEGSTFLHKLGEDCSVGFLNFILRDPHGNVRAAINLKNMHTGGTILYYVCAHKIELRNKLLLLLRGGADPNMTCNVKMSPIQRIIGIYKETCAMEYVRLLIDRGANVNHQDFRGNTVLHYAVNYAHGTQTLSYLLTLGDLTLTTKNNDGETALDLARFKNFTDDAQLIEAEIERRIRERENRELVTMQGVHRRLGQNSLLNVLDGNLLHNGILSYHGGDV